MRKNLDYTQLDEVVIRRIAEIICGDNSERDPVYRSSWYLTDFFKRCGLSKSHDGSTRYIWVFETLKTLNSDEIEKVLLRLTDLREYEGDRAKTLMAVSSLNEVLELEGLKITYVDNKPTVIENEFEFKIDNNMVNVNAVNSNSQQSVEYVQQSIIDEFINSKSEFNVDKLVGMLINLNYDYSNGQAYSSFCLIRAVIDHIPPLFGFYTFDKVVERHPWHRSDKKYAENLLNSKSLGDDILHRVIDADDNTAEISDLPPKKWLNNILREALKQSTKPLPRKNILADKQKIVSEATGKSSLVLKMVEHTVLWDNFQYGLGFMTDIEIDNFDGKDDILLDAFVEAQDSHASRWTTASYRLHISQRDEPESSYTLIQSGKIIKARLFLLVRNGMGPKEAMPDLDRDTGQLIIKLRSGTVLKQKVRFVE